MKFTSASCLTLEGNETSLSLSMSHGPILALEDVNISLSLSLSLSLSQVSNQFQILKFSFNVSSEPHKWTT